MKLTGIVLLSLVLVAGLLAYGCAAGMAPKPAAQTDPGSERDEVRALEIELERLNGEFGAHQAGSEPDCPRARELLKTIGQLAKRICAIAQRHPADQELKQSCGRAQARAEHAQNVFGGRCPAPGGN